MVERVGLLVELEVEGVRSLVEVEVERVGSLLEVELEEGVELEPLVDADSSPVGRTLSPVGTVSVDVALRLPCLLPGGCLHVSTARTWLVCRRLEEKTLPTLLDHRDRHQNVLVRRLLAPAGEYGPSLR